MQSMSSSGNAGFDTSPRAWDTLPLPPAAAAQRYRCTLASKIEHTVAFEQRQEQLQGGQCQEVDTGYALREPGLGLLRNILQLAKA
jgi:hypothetical protein